jgi:hypothetical protein
MAGCRSPHIGTVCVVGGRQCISASAELHTPVCRTPSAQDGKRPIGSRVRLDRESSKRAGRVNGKAESMSGWQGQSIGPGACRLGTYIHVMSLEGPNRAWTFAIEGLAVAVCLLVWPSNECKYQVRGLDGIIADDRRESLHTFAPACGGFAIFWVRPASRVYVALIVELSRIDLQERRALAPLYEATISTGRGRAASACAA